MVPDARRGLILGAASIAALAIYPVKGCRGIALTSARVLATGLEWDRQWMIVDASGRFVTQRTRPVLATISATLGDGTLRLSREGERSCEIPLALTRAPRRVVVWGDTCEALDEGEDAAAWLSRSIGEPVRLVRATPEMRHANPRWAGGVPAPVGFADGFPVLVTSLASLEWINERLPAPVPMDRFRPNIVLEGLEAFGEDHVDALDVGAVRLRLVKPCTRCLVPSLDQLTGERGLDPVEVLRATRFDRELKGITFGENAVVETGGVISLGAGVRLISSSRPGGRRPSPPPA